MPFEKAHFHFMFELFSGFAFVVPKVASWRQPFPASAARLHQWGESFSILSQGVVPKGHGDYYYYLNELLYTFTCLLFSKYD